MIKFIWVVLRSKMSSRKMYASHTIYMGHSRLIHEFQEAVCISHKLYVSFRAQR